MKTFTSRSLLLLEDQRWVPLSPDRTKKNEMMSLKIRSNAGMSSYENKNRRTHSPVREVAEEASSSASFSLPRGPRKRMLMGSNRLKQSLISWNKRSSHCYCCCMYTCITLKAVVFHFHIALMLSKLQRYIDCSYYRVERLNNRVPIVTLVKSTQV